MHHETDVAWLKAQCAQAGSFSDLVDIAIGELKKFDPPKGKRVGIVCGPITTGGRGSLEENLKVFNATIHGLLHKGEPIFNQIPYEDQLNLFRDRWRDEDPVTRKFLYYDAILYEFYEPLFESGLIQKGWFIPGWMSSIGAQWESERMIAFRISIDELRDDEIKEFLELERRELA